jgi:hypothetical protein
MGISKLYWVLGMIARIACGSGMINGNVKQEEC